MGKKKGRVNVTCWECNGKFEVISALAEKRKFHNKKCEYKYYESHGRNELKLSKLTK